MGKWWISNPVQSRIRWTGDFIIQSSPNPFGLDWILNPADWSSLFHTLILSSVLFSFVYFFVRAFFRSYIFSSTQISSVSFFVHAVFRPCIFRLCHYSYMHSFLRTFFRPRSYVHQLIHIRVRGLRLCAPSSQRCRLYVVGRASRPSTAPIPSATVWLAGQQRGGGRLAARGRLESRVRWPGVSSGAGFWWRPRCRAVACVLCDCCSAETTIQSTMMTRYWPADCRVRREMAPIWRQRMAASLHVLVRCSENSKRYRTTPSSIAVM